jgi:hypothetical protein
VPVRTTKQEFSAACEAVPFVESMSFQGFYPGPYSSANSPRICLQIPSVAVFEKPDFMSLATTSLQSNLTCRSNQLILFDIKPDTSDLRGF